MLVVVDQGLHWAVLDKPAGMTVVSGRGVVRPTLLDLAIERWADARPVHRIDKPTTGLTVVAKSAFGQVALSDAFRRHLIDKRYLAFVVGVPTWESLSIDARLARVDDPDLPKIKGKKTLAIQTIDEENGVRALTRVRVLAKGNGTALVEARPETGRMHQIRAHLAHVGFPLVGDALYGASGDLGRFVESQDVALHAFCVSFPKPEGGRAFVSTRPPTAWTRWASDHGVSLAAIEDARARFMKAAEKIEKPAAPTSTKTPPSKNGPAPAKKPYQKVHKPPAKYAPRPGSRPSSPSSRPSKPRPR